MIYHQGKNLTDIILFLDFGDWYKVFYKNGSKGVYNKNNIVFINHISNEPNIKNLIDYLKEVSKLLSVEDGKDFLYNQLSKMTVLKDSFLSKFLSDKISSNKDDRAVIFPFSTNKSQKKAVYKAISEDLSIIQGPPGTGKTQTILNIIANYVQRGQNVAILSGNNEATKNVEEKLSQEGYSYINAVLGNVENIKAFFEKENAADAIAGEKRGTKDLELLIYNLEEIIDKALEYDVDASKLSQLIGDYRVEKEINDAEYRIKEHNVPKDIKDKQYTSHKLLELTSLMEVLPEDKITTFFNRARLLFSYGIIKAKVIKDNREDIIEYLKNQYYVSKIKELVKERDEKINF